MRMKAWQFGCTECDASRTLVRRARKDLAGLHELREQDKTAIVKLTAKLAYAERELARAAFIQHIWTATVN